MCEMDVSSTADGGDGLTVVYILVGEIITLPGPCTIMARLYRAKNDPDYIVDLYPLWVARSKSTFTTAGLLELIEEGIREYASGNHMWQEMARQHIPLFIRALVIDETEAEQVVELYQARQAGLEYA